MKFGMQSLRDDGSQAGKERQPCQHERGRVEHGDGLRVPPLENQPILAHGHASEIRVMRENEERVVRAS